MMLFFDSMKTWGPTEKAPGGELSFGAADGRARLDQPAAPLVFIAVEKNTFGKEVSLDTDAVVHLDRKHADRLREVLDRVFPKRGGC